MTVDRQKLEREFFRMLNRVVEPAVRRGIGSPRFVPGGLILLESVGFKSAFRPSPRSGPPRPVPGLPQEGSTP